MSGTSSPVIEPSDYGKGERGDAKRWLAAIELAKKAAVEWDRQCQRVERRYRDERPTDTNGLPASGQSKRFNILWSNVATLAPAIYSQPPSPVIGRRYRDSDRVARAASEILMRCLSDAIEETDLDERFRQIRTDYLLFGRGTLWLRYVPHTAPMLGHNGGPPLDDKDGGVSITENMDAEESIVAEEVQVDFVNRSDFIHEPARTWEEVGWVARGVRMTREELTERFRGLTTAQIEQIPLNWRPDGMREDDDTGRNEQFKRALIWEIWHKHEKKTLFLADGFGEFVLEEADDPLELRDFFPCPRPLFATVTNSSTIPVPDFHEYADQAVQLDDLTARIAAIVQTVRNNGVYDARWPELASLFNDGADNKLVAVEQWTEFATKKGLAGALDMLDISGAAESLQVLTATRQQIKEDLYEVTGIADVIRGSTQPQETATAQRIKGRYASMRLLDRQLEMSRFVRDTLRLMGEVIARHFQPDTLVELSNFMETELAREEMQRAMESIPEGIPPELGQRFAQQAALKLAVEAVALLKNARSRQFRIDIEDRSTIRADDQEEKASRVEFLGAVGSFLKEAAQLPPNLAPTLGPLLGKMLLFGVRGFRAGVEMESAVEDAVAKMEELAKQPQPPAPPDPAVIKAQIDAQVSQAELQLKQQQAALDMRLADQRAQMEAGKAALEAQQHQRQNEQDDRQHLIDIGRMDLDRERLAFERDKAAMEHDRELATMEMEKVRMAHDAGQPKAEGDGGAPKPDISGLLTKLDAVTAHLAAPKRIVRDGGGRISHIEPMGNA